MKWITKNQVKAAAKKSHKAAVAMTKKHWHQLFTATKQEIIDAYRKGLVACDDDYCALCKRYHKNKSCNECPLKDSFPRSCCKEWRDAVRKFDPYGGRLWRHREFQRAAGKMYQKICKLEG